MTAAIWAPTSLPAGKALQAHHQKMRAVDIGTLLADDPQRGERMTAEGADIVLDYSKNRAQDHALALLVRLAEESGLRARIDAMFRG
jgi:glucose-6-phosphate isomerase